MRCSTIHYNQASKGFVFNLCWSMVKKDKVSKFFCTKSAHARSFRSCLYWFAEWACLRHVLIEIINSSRSIQMSGPLLELRGGYMVVFQVNVLQVTLVRQLVDNVSECFTFYLFTKNRGILRSLARVPWHLMFQYSSWILPYWWSLSVLSLCGLRRSRRSRRNQRCKVFVINGLITLFFERFLSCCWTLQEVGHPHHHLHACLMHELDVLVFALTWQKLHVSLGWPSRSLDLVVGWYVRLVRSNTCPQGNTQTKKRTSRELGMQSCLLEDPTQQ